MSDCLYPISPPSDRDSRLHGLVDAVMDNIERAGFKRPGDGDRPLLEHLLHEFMFGVPAAAVVAGRGLLRQPPPGACPRCQSDDRVRPLGVEDGRGRLYCDRCDRRFSAPVESGRAA